MKTNNSHFQYFNPNPTARYKKDGTPMKWHKGDCVVRALCACTGMPWTEMYNIMVQRGLERYTMPNSEEVYEWILEQNGFVRNSFKRTEKKPTLNEFCKTHPNGIYVIRISSHLVTIKDGKIQDTWDCGAWTVRSYFSKVS